MTFDPTNPFGPIFVVTDLETMLVSVLGGWFPTYLDELQRQHPIVGGITLAPPASISVHRSVTRWVEEALPGIVVQVPGTLGSTEKRGDGSIDSWYAVTVLCVVAAPSLEDTTRLSGYYAAAARAILMQQRDLAGIVADVEFVDETHDRLIAGTADNQRSVQTAMLTMRMLVQGVVNARYGPAGIDGLPDPAHDPTVPYDPLTTVITPVVDAQTEPVGQDT